MDDTMLEQRLENLDHRLERAGQILPTLATKEDLETLATKKDLETLATKEDLETLATKEDLDSLATKEELQDLRRHMGVLTESLRDDIQLIAAHVASWRSKDTTT